ncbi:MAG TPA: ferredoxin reductase family protein [Candidatus Nanopelagicales bacterium]|nr:ferredoxin reductase family protein [Candidatus Nanopelagicales bacterium]
MSVGTGTASPYGGTFLPEGPAPVALAPVAPAAVGPAPALVLLPPPVGAPVDEGLLRLPPPSSAPVDETLLAPAPPPQRSRRRQRRGVAAEGRGTRRGDVAVSLAGLGLGLCAGLGVFSVKDGLDLPGGVALAAGTIAAMVGTYLCLVLLLLVARIPWIEREVGHDRLVSLHRRVAPYAILLILAHAVLTTLAYAQVAQTGFLAEVEQLVLHTAWMMPATVAFGLVMTLGLLSYRRIRERMTYETWWVAHLYFYVAVALAFGHQLELGPMFVDEPLQRAFWIGLYVVVAVAVVGGRLVLPLRFSLRHDLRVAAVVREADGVSSVYLSGIDLDQLQARGGQFFQWRFLTRDMWWQAHPYSLSAAPNPSWLRITVKGLGDHSRGLHRLPVGTRVVAEGPYGVFHAAARHGDRVAAFAAGVGVAPVRAMLEDLPEGTAVTIVYRVPDSATAPLGGELEALVRERGWRLHYLQGPRRHHPMTVDYLRGLVPGLAESDVFVCGPDSFTERIVETVVAAGVPRTRIHHEAFAF